MNSFLNCLARWLVMVVWCACIMTGGSELMAQNYCTNAPAGTGVGSFSLNRTRTCANLPITVTNTLAGAQNITYNYQYSGNGLPVTNLTPNSSTTYTSPGTFTILQVGTSSATGFAKCETVTILPTEAINFSTQSCENQQVTASFLFTPNTEQYDEVEVDWGDGVKQKYTVANLKAGPIKHQYPGGGASYTISVRGLYNGVPDCNALPTTKPVTPIVGAAGTPQITRLKTIGQTSVEMLIQGPVNTDFEVFIKRPDGSFSSMGTYQRDGGKPVYNADVRTPQCFQVRSVSSCTPTTNAEEYCTLALNASAVQGQNNVTWTPYTGASPTIIWRMLRNGANVPVPGNTNKNTKSYTDQNNIQCNTPYCYQVTATAGPTEYISNVVCVTGISNNQPTALTNITVSVQGNGQVSIRTNDPNPTGGGTYTLLVGRADSPAGPFKEIGQATNQAVFEDPTARTADQSYCYRLTLQNECGQLSVPSAPACTVWLRSDSPGALDWTADSPFGERAVAEYEVVFIDRASGVEIKRQSVGGNTHFEPDRNDPDIATYRYEIIAITATRQTSRSNPYELQVEAGIFAPTAFAPNGANNRFQVKGDLADDFRLTIYDRWGTVIYFTTSFTDQDGWDGNAGGQPAAAGTYAWRAEVRDKAGKQTVKIGSVLLIR